MRNIEAKFKRKLSGWKTGLGYTYSKKLKNDNLLGVTIWIKYEYGIR